MASVTVTVRGLGGTKTITVDSDSDDITVGDIREAAGIVEGVVLRFNGETASDDLTVEDGATLVSAPASAKHGS